MVGPGNNQPNNPGSPSYVPPLPFGENVETVFIGQNFFFNNPGQYNITLGNDLSGRPETNARQLTMSVPTSSASITRATSANRYGAGATAAAATSVRNQGGSTRGIADGNGNRASSTKPSGIERVNMSVTPKEIQEGTKDKNGVR